MFTVGGCKLKIFYKKYWAKKGNKQNWKRSKNSEICICVNLDH